MNNKKIVLPFLIGALVVTCGAWAEQIAQAIRPRA